MEKYFSQLTSSFEHPHHMLKRWVSNYLVTLLLLQNCLSKPVINMSFRGAMYETRDPEKVQETKNPSDVRVRRPCKCARPETLQCSANFVAWKTQMSQFSYLPVHIT